MSDVGDTGLKAELVQILEDGRSLVKELQANLRHDLNVGPQDTAYLMWWKSMIRQCKERPNETGALMVAALLELLEPSPPQGDLPGGHR